MAASSAKSTSTLAATGTIASSRCECIVHRVLLSYNHNSHHGHTDSFPLSAITRTTDALIPSLCWLQQAPCSYRCGCSRCRARLYLAIHNSHCILPASVASLNAKSTSTSAITCTTMSSQCDCIANQVLYLGCNQHLHCILPMQPLDTSILFQTWPLHTLICMLPLFLQYLPSCCCLGIAPPVRPTTCAGRLIVVTDTVAPPSEALEPIIDQP